jgi:hypothetical protein
LRLNQTSDHHAQRDRIACNLRTNPAYHGSCSRRPQSSCRPRTMGTASVKRTRRKQNYPPCLFRVGSMSSRRGPRGSACHGGPWCACGVP